jgi:predicted metal-dependent hydrolase
MARRSDALVSGSGAPTLTVRRPTFSFACALDAHWLGDDAAKSRLLDSMGLFFPRLEEFLIRVAKDARGERASPELRSFIAQEAQHLAQHRRQSQQLRDRGKRVDDILRLFDRLVGAVERTSLATRLAVAAAGEHFTAAGSAHFLRTGWTAGAPPELRALYEWHFAEEIEHRAVLFDATRLRRVGASRRALGLAIATILIPVAFLAGMGALLWRDGSLRRVSTWRAIVRLLFARDGLAPMTFRATAVYLRPNFHPLDAKDDALARAVFDSPQVREFLPNPGA